MKAIKKYPLGQLFGSPYDHIDFAVLNADELKQLASAEPNAGVPAFHQHEFYTVFWITSGELSQELDNTTYILGKGDIFVICPGQLHENNFSYATNQIEGGAALFTAEFISRLKKNEEISELIFLDNVYSNPHLHMSEPDLSSFLSIASVLYTEVHKPAPSPAMIRSLFSSLLLSVQQVIDAPLIKATSGRHIEVYKKFKQELEIHYKTQKSLGFYAGLLNTSERHLNRMLKEVTSRTAVEMIRGRAILEAKRLLTFTDLNITEIAGSLGYLDTSYFSKMFRRETGHTPLHYRSWVS